MDKQQINDYSSFQNASDEDFELMGDMPKEDPVIIEVKNFPLKFYLFIFSMNSILASS
jgi:hypothetical protein